jgi:DndB-like DNA-sulfur modification-associated protein
MESSYPAVLTSDGGHLCWDTTISAREIAQVMRSGMVEYDPDHQRGKDTVTGKLKVDRKRVEEWARDLQADTAIFGQLTWNFRPEETGSIRFVPDHEGSPSGKLYVEDGQAKIPDSMHRHEAIKMAVDSISNGSSFDPARRFSLRIWRVPAAYEDIIFNAMNTQHKKADSTRSKFLYHRGPAQKLARELVRRSPHLGEVNVETVSNTVSMRNPRLAAFNTFSTAFEAADGPWSTLTPDEVDGAATFLVKFWDKLVQVVPDLGVLPVDERQRARKESLSTSAIAIHGYLRMAHYLYPDGDLSVLDRLNGQDGFFQMDNPLFTERGVTIPGSGRSSGKLIVRSSHASRRAMGEILAQRCGLTSD